MKFKNKKFVSLCLIAGISMALSASGVKLSSSMLSPGAIEEVSLISNLTSNISFKDKNDNGASGQTSQINIPSSIKVIKYKYSHAGAPRNYSALEIRQALKEASNVWASSCGVEFEEVASSDSNDAALFHPIGTIKWATIAQDAAATATLGNAQAPAYNFIMSLKAIELRSIKGGINNLKWIFVHELGHVIGLNHNANKQSVMNVKTLRSPGNILSNSDVFECQSLKKGWKV